ncbi:MAG TPA: dihydrodipicolinate synthase family protein [Anaerolineales bacterium]|nr:dihydrodipicolinate synthase family protein [Anaerolineales bacterium]
MTESPLDLSGVFPPIPTPFDAGGNIAYDRLSQNLERWNGEPMAGVVVGGSNGEFPLLTVDERVEVVRRARREVAPSRRVIGGSGMESTSSSISVTRAMAEAGADAVLVVTPSYYRARMTAAALIDHYTSIAESSPVPIVIYNVPANTGVDMAAEVVVELSHHPGIVGVKDSSGDLVKLTRLVAESAEGFQVLAGSAGTFLPALAVGAVGVVAALANIAAAELADLYRRFRAGDAEGARALQGRLMAANAAVTSRFGVPGLKCAMDLTGRYGGPPRPPLQPLGEAERESVRASLERAGIATPGAT